MCGWYACLPCLAPSILVCGFAATTNVVVVVIVVLLVVLVTLTTRKVSATSLLIADRCCDVRFSDGARTALEMDCLVVRRVAAFGYLLNADDVNAVAEYRSSSCMTWVATPSWVPKLCSGHWF